MIAPSAATAICLLNLGEWYRSFHLVMFMLHLMVVSRPLVQHDYHLSPCPISLARLKERLTDRPTWRHFLLTSKDSKVHRSQWPAEPVTLYLMTT